MTDRRPAEARAPKISHDFRQRGAELKPGLGGGITEVLGRCFVREVAVGANLRRRTWRLSW
jgi:hypothetical protein